MANFYAAISKVYNWRIMISKIKSLFSKKSANLAENKSYEQLYKEYVTYKSDNVKLIYKVATLEFQVQSLTTQLYDKSSLIEDLEMKIKEFDGFKKVTYASARKSMTKATLKKLRKSLEDIPDNVNGFHGTVFLYDKKSKGVKSVNLTSKEQALEIVDKAEKGYVDIIF